MNFTIIIVSICEIKEENTGVDSDQHVINEWSLKGCFMLVEQIPKIPTFERLNTQQMTKSSDNEQIVFATVGVNFHL